jgi:oxygen-dependent protoporphyrinogen oxidase
VAGLPDNSGVLIAAGEPLSAKAFTYSARKWPHLAPEAGSTEPGSTEPGSTEQGLFRLRASLGRAGDETTLQVPDEELVARVRADLAELAGVTAAPVAVHVQRWGGGLPQYGLDHGRLVEGLLDAVAGLDRLEVAGSLLHGVGVPACIGTARAAAERLTADLSARVGGRNGSMAV